MILDTPISHKKRYLKVKPSFFCLCVLNFNSAVEHFEVAAHLLVIFFFIPDFIERNLGQTLPGRK